MNMAHEIHIPKNEYIPTEEDIYANGWNEEWFAKALADDHIGVERPCTPLPGETDEERDRRNMIIQERYFRTLGMYWADNKYARLT